MVYQGSCHCGGITFEVEGTVDSALACNCSICHRRGSLLWFVPRDALRLNSPHTTQGTYMFNRHAIKHHFCTVCGIHPYGEGVDPAGRAMAAVNLRCIEGLDLAAIPVHTYDGRAV